MIDVQLLSAEVGDGDGVTVGGCCEGVVTGSMAIASRTPAPVIIEVVRRVVLYPSAFIDTSYRSGYILSVVKVPSDPVVVVYFLSYVGEVNVTSAPAIGVLLAESTTVPLTVDVSCGTGVDVPLAGIVTVVSMESIFVPFRYAIYPKLSICPTAAPLYTGVSSVCVVPGSTMYFVLFEVLPM